MKNGKGMYSLFTFYRSKKWQTLVRQIRDERADGQGKTICEYCGKPITKEYDCIGHHIQALTEENVNDYKISLNQGNIMLVHHKCHNIIHDKLSTRERKVYLVYGSPLAGKTSYVLDAKSDGDLIIDIDDIWQCVSGCKRYIKPNRLKSVVFAVRDTLLDCVKYRRGKWANAYIVGGYPLAADRERLCRELGAEEIFVECDKEECTRRLEACDDRDKKEWNRFIEEWFDRFTRPTSSD